MKYETISLLRSPIDGQPFRFEAERGHKRLLQEWLVAEDGSHRFPVVSGIPSFIADDTSGARSARGGLGILGGLIGGGREKLRQDILKQLSIRTRERVLHLSIGSGSDLKNLHPNAEFYGLDTSLESLKQTQKNLQKWRIDAELIHAQPEALPFDADTFDAIAHLDGFGGFGSTATVLAEVIRVAKPGAQILLGGESGELAKIGDPLSLIPGYMLDLRSERANGGSFYTVSFRKPFEDARPLDAPNHRGVRESNRLER